MIYRGSLLIFVTVLFASCNRSSTDNSSAAPKPINFLQQPFVSSIIDECSTPTVSVGYSTTKINGHMVAFGKYSDSVGKVIQNCRVILDVENSGSQYINTDLTYKIQIDCPSIPTTVQSFGCSYDMSKDNACISHNGDIVAAQELRFAYGTNDLGGICMKNWVRMNQDGYYVVTHSRSYDNGSPSWQVAASFDTSWNCQNGGC
jgi:hypothetical protein